jgi:N-acyl-D-aspartate/D-glutamate deacylase
VSANRNPKVVRKLLFHPQLLPGFNDSGAHLTNMAFFDGNLRTLRIAQEAGVSRVAQAVRRMTTEPAEFLGIDAKGVEVGARADLVLIDPPRLREWDPESTYRYVWRDCFSHHQLVNRPDGVVTDVMISGKFAWRAGTYEPAFGRKRYGQLLLVGASEAEVAASG